MPEITRAKTLHEGQFNRLIKITQATSPSRAYQHRLLAALCGRMQSNAPGHVCRCHLIYGLLYGKHCHILQYMAVNHTSTHRPTARVGWNNRSQTVTMPLEYRFPESVREVFIRREGESVVLTPRPSDWSGFFASGMKASTDFMADIERMPIQERSF